MFSVKLNQQRIPLFGSVTFSTWLRQVVTHFSYNFSKKKSEFSMNLLNTLNVLIYFWKIRYFIVKSCNRENLELSVQQGVWATQRSNEAKLNEAFDSADNVILIFSVNRTRHFQVPTIRYCICACYFLVMEERSMFVWDNHTDLVLAA